jgi:hypothetical protein
MARFDLTRSGWKRQGRVPWPSSKLGHSIMSLTFSILFIDSPSSPLIQHHGLRIRLTDAHTAHDLHLCPQKGRRIHLSYPGDWLAGITRPVPLCNNSIDINAPAVYSGVDIDRRIPVLDPDVPEFAAATLPTNTAADADTHTSRAPTVPTKSECECCV